MPDAAALFDWAERTYAQYFPGPQANQVSPPYTYRHYPTTGNYVGVAGDDVYILGPVSGGALQHVGKRSDFACLVYPASCAATAVAQVHSGGTVVYVRLRDGRLYAKGSGANCQIGDGDAVDRPVPVSLGGNWTSITGRGTLVGLKDDGSVWAWGINVGDGSKSHRCAPKRVAEGFRQVANGAHAEYSRGPTIGVKLDGSLWVWGPNILRNSTEFEPHEFLTPTRLGNDADWTQAVAGADHLLAVKRDGSLWAWGRNAYGQLGNGKAVIVVAEVTPQRVLEHVVAIAAASYRSYAVTSSGALYGWGWNALDGLVGDDTNIDRHTPTLIGQGFVSVSASDERVVALKADGSAWSWGPNQQFHGVVGDGTLVPRAAPVQVATGMAQVTTSSQGAVALDTQGRLWGWGTYDFARDARSGNFLYMTHRVPTMFSYFP
ncbi:hypothetical protein HLB44_36290 [Aquincola sp. S2]|uniref:Chromosome condensation regulator RCC1 n=1 Tax=Pseudaquabacterium terrae TaxID=2732868 RepID=A0ABX2EUL7_9BURK|nr:hypothetical protein [Aquabacterium terrae]